MTDTNCAGFDGGFERREVILFGRWMRARELKHARRDDNRIVRPFAWGLEFVSEHVNGADPRALLREHTLRTMAGSEDFYALPEINDFALQGDGLTWTSAVKRSEERRVG